MRKLHSIYKIIYIIADSEKITLYQIANEMKK